MTVYQIEHVRAFMSKLLLSDSFDHFLVSEVSVTTYAAFHIDGHLQREFFDADATSDAGPAVWPDLELPLVSWRHLKKHCLALIRGTRTPLAFQIVFQLPPKEAAELITREGLSVDPDEVHGLFFNCRFRTGNLQVTSGASLAFFDQGRQLEHAWDAYLTNFLRRQELI